MRFRLSILTLFRSPMKTLVTFLLLLATSFAFVSRGAEYATTVAEINKAEVQYSAVGTLQRSTEGYYEYMEETIGPEVYEYENGAYIDRLSNATAPLESEVVDLVLGSEHIAQDEFFVVAGGLTHEYENVLEQPLYDVPNYTEWEWDRLEGTFRMDTAFVETLRYAGMHYLPTVNGSHVEKVIVGNSELFEEKQRYHIHDYFVSSENPVSTDADQNRFFISIGTSMYHNSDDINRNLVVHVNYPIINLTELKEKYGTDDYIEALNNPEKYGLSEYRSKYGLPSVSTLEYMETLYRNNHTAEVVHISSMEKLDKYHSGELHIMDGRAITSSDAENICVISSAYAKKNGLSIGDTIEYELCADTMTHSGKVFGREPPYPALDMEDAFEYDTVKFSRIASEQSLTEHGLDTVTQTYEIVGIWSDSNYDVADPFSYSPNTVFVPASTYPWAGEVEPTMIPSTFSFTLNHPGDMAKIEAELGDQLATLGYELSINDMGYAEAKPSFEFMKLSALIGFIAMSAALLLSLILTVYLYIIRKKHDYAIMRALGTTRARSNRSLLVGLFALAIPAVFLGSLLALALTQGFAADLSAQISEITGSATASSMPAWLVGAFGAGVLGLLLIFARAGLVRVGRTPPLALLQGR